MDALRITSQTSVPDAWDQQGGAKMDGEQGESTAESDTNEQAMRVV